MKTAWQRLIRFVATDGRTLYGEPILSNPDFDLGNTTRETGLKAKVISGTDLYDTTGATKVTEETVTVEKLLGPLSQEDVPIVRCIGLNYKTHSEYPCIPPHVMYYRLGPRFNIEEQSRKQAAHPLPSPPSSSNPTPPFTTMMPTLSSRRLLRTIRPTTRANYAL